MRRPVKRSQDGVFFFFRPVRTKNAARQYDDIRCGNAANAMSKESCQMNPPFPHTDPAATTAPDTRARRGRTAAEQRALPVYFPWPTRRRAQACRTRYLCSQARAAFFRHCERRLRRRCGVCPAAARRIQAETDGGAAGLSARYACVHGDGKPVRQRKRRRQARAPVSHPPCGGGRRAALYRPDMRRPGRDLPEPCST